MTDEKTPCRLCQRPLIIPADNGLCPWCSAGECRIAADHYMHAPSPGVLKQHYQAAHGIRP